MSEKTSIQEIIKQLRCCVIIPTYNNAGTLEKIIRGVQEYTHDIIVVNDGSTDDTHKILENLLINPVIDLPANQGKGIALRKGFDEAIRQGFRYAITIDSDGQHFPEDIPEFISKIENEPDTLIIGARNMKQGDVPPASNFGHRFSIFWFRVETGLKVPDVQSGYRLYPLDKIKDIRHFYSGRYEFEVEVMVRLAWRGVPVSSVPVRVWYGSEHERVSHFRKGRDFARTGLLNTILVLAALLWVRPFHFAKGLQKKSFREIIRDYIINGEDSNAKISWSVMLGIFIGVSPFWGYQMIVAVGLAHLFRLNKFIALVASNISIPPMIPVILFCSYITGGFILGAETSDLHYSAGINFQWIEKNLIQYIAGSFVFGTVLAPAAGLVTYLFLVLFRKRIRNKEHVNTRINH